MDQVSKLFGTGLYEGTDGAEYSFVPTKKMEALQEEILDYYNKINTTDHSIFVCGEVYFTTKIEGANTTYRRTIEIHNGKEITPGDFSEQMVKNGFAATKFLNLYGNKITEPILIQMWQLLTKDACDNEEIKGEKYRIGTVGVGKHIGISVEYIEDAMNSWIDFYNSDTMNDMPFVKAALLHYSFENTHPFCDGNGRAGRLLMINYLIKQGFDKLKAVSFSAEIANNLNGYYNAFDQSENSYFDCTPFIEYMLDIYATTLYNILEKGKDAVLDLVPDKNGVEIE